MDVLIEFDRLPEGLPVGALREAIALVDKSLAPASLDDDQVAMAIIHCRSRTARPQEGRLSEQEEDLFAAALAEDVAAYPLDVIQAVFRKWPENHRFFPNNWHDVKALLDEKMKFRRKAKVILEQRLAQGINKAESEVEALP